MAARREVNRAPRQAARRSERRRQARRRALIAGTVGASIVVAGLMFAFYFPTRTWLHQRSRTAASRHQLAELDAANRQLARRVAALKDPATIERLARANYGLVRPGEKAYVLLPPASGPTDLPQVWPFVSG